MEGEVPLSREQNSGWCSYFFADCGYGIDAFVYNLLRHREYGREMRTKGRMLYG
jgi:hypothetical protein